MINFLILSKTNSNKIFNMTNNLIQSLINTVYPINSSLSTFRIIMIQSQNNCEFKYKNCITIQFDQKKFNYNHALNQGIKFCLNNFNQNDWFCCMNNDLICDKNWIIGFNNAIKQYPMIESLCPCIDKTKQNIQFGYTIFKHMVGYCFMFQKNILNKINIFDQTFNFYFQDDDYIQQLRNNKIIHAIVKQSKVFHIGQQTESTNYKQLIYGRNNFIKKYSLQIYNNREKQKYIKE